VNKYVDRRQFNRKVSEHDLTSANGARVESTRGFVQVWLSRRVAVKYILPTDCPLNVICIES
jgi:hypothetical protein